MDKQMQEMLETAQDSQALRMIQTLLDELHCKKDPNKTRLMSVKSNISLMREHLEQITNH